MAADNVISRRFMITLKHVCLKEPICPFLESHLNYFALLFVIIWFQYFRKQTNKKRIMLEDVHICQL